MGIFTLVALFPLVLLFVAMLFTIRGYLVHDRNLVIERLGWVSTVKLDNLETAYADPKAMKHSLRMFGNGGLFCFAGLFYNKKLGRYRVFVTNPKNSVVLKFPLRTVVVSPDDPEIFVSTTQKFIQATE